MSWIPCSLAQSRLPWLAKDPSQLTCRGQRPYRACWRSHPRLELSGIVGVLPHHLTIQQLGIERKADGTFHGLGVDSNLASPFQPLAVCPLHQEPVDLLPGAGLDAANVLLDAGGTGGPAKGKTSEAAMVLRVVQEERQLGVGQLLPVLEDGGCGLSSAGCSGP